MLFNSSTFAIFFPIVTAGYFLLPPRLRWMWLLAASCVFYMFFIPVYILILGFTIVVDYFAAFLIARASGARRRFWLGASIVANVGVLAVFKYAGFAAENLAAIARLTGWNYSLPALGIILPIGLSFHTFQAMSYTIEVYRGNQAPERHFGIYALYVMFYPQLVAGPIERPQNLLPQFRESHVFEYQRVADGLRLMAWGFFKKLVIADRLAKIVNPVYLDPSQYAGPHLTLATIAFAFQIYGDFSGYSDIAIGASRVMGIELMQNFRAPYLSRSVTEFWRRWHISLSSWFRDYVYVPLGGNRVGRIRQLANVMIVFALSGLWHGANWTFVVWGMLHGVFVSAGVIARWFRGGESTGDQRVPAFVRTLWTFALVGVGWIFFRARSIGEGFYIATHLHRGWTWPGSAALTRMLADPVTRLGFLDVCVAVVVVAIMLAMEARDPDEPFSSLTESRPWWVRWPAYYAIIAVILIFGVFERSRFIYFQF